MADQSYVVRKKLQLESIRLLRMELLKLRIENLKIRNRAAEANARVQEKFLNEGIAGILHRDASSDTKAVAKSVKLIEELGLDKEGRI